MSNGLSNGFRFGLDRSILAGGANLALHVQADPVLAALLKNNAVVPTPDAPIVLGSANLTVEGDQEFALGSGTGTVGFAASAGAKLGIFGLPGQLRDGIIEGGDLAESIEPALNFDTGAAGPFLLLRFGYDVEGSASGSVALGAAGKLTFSANADRHGLYAIVRQAPADLRIVDGLRDLVQHVRLPKQVTGVDDLLPGSWIIAETDGSVGFRADVQFGHDFSWIRETSLGTLQGDVGLKVAAGISAGLGFSAAGKYAVVLGRASLNPADKRLRLRIFKLRMHEMDLAFRAQAVVTPVAGILPAQFDDFLKGVLGVHANQVMRELGRFDDWTKPDAPLFGPFVDLAADKARELVSAITGIEDLAGRFDEAKGRIRILFQRWDALPSDAASRLMALAGDVPALARLRGLVSELSKADDDQLEAKVRDLLKDVAFLQSPEGRLIEKAATNGLFAALTNTGLLDQLRNSAGDLAALLDGSVIEAMLTRLQAEVSTRLHLDRIEEAVGSADLGKLDAWLRARLNAFLEEKLAGPGGVARLRELRDTLRKLRETAPELYTKALAALQRDYTFSINATYTKTTTTTALVDAEFDFGVARSAAAEALRLSLLGRFDDLIGTSRPGVTVSEGMLTHGIRRESHVAVALPFFSREEQHVNQALAQFGKPERVGGQLFYQVTAQDVVTVKNRHAAALTITMQLAQRSRTEVRVHADDAATYLQSIDRAMFDASTEEVVQYAAPFVTPLFPGDFGTRDFAAWVRDAFGANTRLGHTLLSLDVTLPPTACLAWLNAPKDKKSPVYQQLSVALQQRFKQLIHDTFFHSIRRYSNVAGASDTFSVLVFSSLPAATEARLVKDKITIAPAEFTSGDVYWDNQSDELRRRMAGATNTRVTLLGRLANARRRLQIAGDPDKKIGFFKDGAMGSIIGAVQDGALFQSLLRVERRMVTQAREAGLDMATFNEEQLRDAAKARKALAEFGAGVTATFNAELKNIALGDALRPLGALMFIEAAKVFDPSLAARTSALFTLTDVRDEVRFPPDNFPNHDTLPATDVVLSETIVHVAER